MGGTMSRTTARLAWPLASVLCLLGFLGSACGPASPGGEAFPAPDGRAAAATRAPVVLSPAIPYPTEGFGHAVAIAGSAVAITDFLDSDHADVHTYWLDGASAWPTGTVKPADVTERCFGTALAFQYGWLAVGSPCALAGRGEVRVYAQAGDGWVEDAALGEQVGATALFGRAVAAGQGRLVVGAPAEGAAAGAAYVYRLGAGGWTLEARLAPADLVPGDQFGFDVAVSPTLIAVAMPGRAEADALAPSGRVVVYRLGRSGWVEEAVLAPADTAIGERAARAVAAGPGVVAVAGDPVVPHSLHAFVKVGGAWVEEDVEPGLRGRADAGFVHALAMDGNLLVVGMPTLSGEAGEYRPGAAWVYQRAAGGWTRLTPVPSVSHPLDKSGHAVAVSRGTVVVGGPGIFQPGVSAGSGEVTIERR